MKLQQLQYFKALAEKEHLFKTATELYISPPALSATISRLEEELGVPLFDHVGRNIKLNKNGEKFYLHVKNVLAELDQACAELKGDVLQDTLSLNVVTTTNISWGKTFAEFIHHNPHIVFNHRVMDVDQLFSASLENQPDFIVTALPDIPNGRYEYAVLIPNDNPMLAVYDGHHLCDREEISLKEVCHEPFIALPKGYAMRKYFDTLCDLAGFTPNIVAEADVQLRSWLVKKHMGITLTTQLGTGSYLLDGLKFIKITDPIYPRTQGIMWPKGRELTPHAKAFLAFMCEYYRIQGISEGNT